jgi:hypothetical protein
MLRLVMAFLLVLLAGAATPLTAQVRYKDSEGVMHWVNSIDEVPERYRAGAGGRPVAPLPPGTKSDWEEREEQKAREIDRQRQERKVEQEQARKGPPDRFVLWQEITGERPKNASVWDSKEECMSLAWKLPMEEIGTTKRGNLPVYISYKCLPAGVNP